MTSILEDERRTKKSNGKMNGTSASESNGNIIEDHEKEVGREDTENLFDKIKPVRYLDKCFDWSREM